MVRVRLTSVDKEKLWCYISDSDIFFGSDGHAYMEEKALIWYYTCKFELERVISDVEKGILPEV